MIQRQVLWLVSDDDRRWVIRLYSGLFSFVARDGLFSRLDQNTPVLFRQISRDINEATDEWGRGRGRGQRCRISYKNTVHERLSSDVNIKKSHPVWQSQQCQCISSLAIITLQQHKNLE